MCQPLNLILGIKNTRKEKEAIHWEKTFAKHTSGKELFSKIHHKGLNLTIKRQTHSLKKNTGGKKPNSLKQMYTWQIHPM